MMLTSLLAVAHSAPPTNSCGKLAIRLDGAPTAFDVVALNNTPASIVNVSGSTLQLAHGPGPAPAPGLSRAQGTRLWLAHDGSLDAHSYVQFSLLNRSLSYTIDLAEVPCSCNAALYWVAMPGVDSDGAPAPSSMGSYYCDANKIGGVPCFEIDTFEGNQAVMQVTAHRCQGAAGGYNPSCDGAGRFTSTELLSIAGPLRRPLCARADCVVDTRRPFRVTQRFVTDASGSLVAIENDVRQGNASFSFSSADRPRMRDYLSSMTDAMRRGMVLAFQLWGGGWPLMSWLDAWTLDPLLCKPGDHCPESSRVVYSDLAIDRL